MRSPYQTAKLDRFVEEFIVDDAFFGVSRLPGQLYASICHPAHFKFARLTRH